MTTTTRPPTATGDRLGRSLPVAAITVTLLLWASAFVAIRDLGGTVGPGALSLGRLVVGAVALGVLLGIRRVRGRVVRWPGRRDWPLLAVCGVAWFGIYNLALNASEQRIDAGTAALVIQVGPLLVAALAAVFLHEPLHRWLVIGCGVGFAGVVLIAQGSAGAAHLDPLGVALALVSAAAFAVGVLCQKPLVGHVGALELTFCACAIGAVVCLPWSGDLLRLLGSGDTTAIVEIAYLGVFPTAVAFSTWAYALAHTDAGKQALTTFLVPLLTTVMAWAWLDEVPPPLSFIGGGLAIVGVLLTRVRPVRRRPSGAR